jgi:hypothetical protein
MMIGWLLIASGSIKVVVGSSLIVFGVCVFVGDFIDVTVGDGLVCRGRFVDRDSSI